MKRDVALIATVLSMVLTGTSRADEPAAKEHLPFVVADTPARDDLLRRFEEIDVLRDALPLAEVVTTFRNLHRDALKEYGPDVYEPYAVLDRLATFYDDRNQTAKTSVSNNAQTPEAAQNFLRATKATRSEIIAALERSKVVDWRKRGEIAKHRGLLHLYDGDVDRARPELEEAVKQFRAHPGAGDYSLARVLLSVAQVAVAQERWDDAEATCDQLFRVFHRLHARALDQLSLDLLARAEGLAAYQLAYTLARRRADLPGKAAKYAEWNLNAKVYRREIFARQLASLRSGKDPQTVKIRDRLRDGWGELAELALQPTPTRPTQAMQLRQARKILAVNAEVKGVSRDASRVAPPPADTPDDWVTVDQVRSTLPSDAVLIDLVGYLEFDVNAPAGTISWSGARDIAFVIPAAGRGEVHLVDLGDSEQVWRVFDAYVRGMGPVDPDDAETLREADTEAARVTHDVSRTILHPLLPYVKDARRWVISPYALSWLVPWSTLVRDDGELVVDHHATSYVLAGRHVVRGVVDRGKAETGPPLIVAAPDYDRGRKEEDSGGPFSPLPETAAEARAIAPHLEAYAKAAPRILLGAEALESAVLTAPAPRVLVASTHGYYGGLPDSLVKVSSPMLRCGLAFAGANARLHTGGRPGDDGVATGLEILAADFRGTDLVVLSACETAYGEFQTSQGLIGLNLAFHLAGAKAVLGALWPVPVDETSELTTEFFAELARGTPGDEALRRSQAKLIKRLKADGGSAHPWLWAGFLLSGNVVTEHPR